MKLNFVLVSLLIALALDAVLYLMAMATIHPLHLFISTSHIVVGICLLLIASGIYKYGNKYLKTLNERLNDYVWRHYGLNTPTITWLSTLFLLNALVAIIWVWIAWWNPSASGVIILAFFTGLIWMLNSLFMPETNK